MTCRVWHGWTTLQSSDVYDDYLQQELFPKLQRKLAGHGYRGFQLLKLKRGEEVEFMTMLWFDSLASVRAFAGENYATPVISEKAQSLLSRYDKRAEHYELSASTCRSFDPAQK